MTDKKLTLNEAAARLQVSAKTMEWIFRLDRDAEGASGPRLYPYERDAGTGDVLVYESDMARYDRVSFGDARRYFPRLRSADEVRRVLEPRCEKREIACARTLDGWLVRMHDLEALDQEWSDPCTEGA